MEYTGFNQTSYENFTPEVTKVHNNQISTVLALAAIVLVVGVIIYLNEIQKEVSRENERIL